MSDKIDSLGDLRMSPQAEAGRSMAPPPRRKSFSKLRRRLSQTFRFSFNGSLSEFPHSFVIKEEPDKERSNGNGKTRIHILLFLSSSELQGQLCSSWRTQNLFCIWLNLVLNIRIKLLSLKSNYLRALYCFNSRGLLIHNYITISPNCKYCARPSLICLYFKPLLVAARLTALRHIDKIRLKDLRLTIWQCSISGL